jgi:superfamily I DNA and/or RNA helicase
MAVFSNKKSGFEVSLFERLMKAGQQVILLDRQYRMHPEINNFPSLTFYESYFIFNKYKKNVL